MSSRRKPTSSLRVDLVFQTRDQRPTLKRWLDVELARIAAFAKVQRGAVTLMLVDDAEMTSLHGRYKKDPTTTDVLTFDLRESAADAIEGDIVLCVDEAARQAKRRGHATRLELLLYAVHGLLHLLGYDDHRAADFRKMHEKEDELLTKAGYGSVFGLSPTRKGAGQGAAKKLLAAGEKRKAKSKF